MPKMDFYESPELGERSLNLCGDYSPYLALIPRRAAAEMLPPFLSVR
jgi:hypothetical protein